jgi:PAS domain S-box-containing protein
LRFLVRLGVFVIFATAIVGIVMLTLDVAKDLKLLKTASSDNVQWTLSQAEVEYLEYQKALDAALIATTPDLNLVRRQFDIFFSRISTLSQGGLYQGLQDVPQAAASLVQIKAALDQSVPIIDADNSVMATKLSNLYQLSDPLKGELRSLSTSGLRYFAQQADSRRSGISETLSRLAIATGLLISALFILSFYFNRVSRLNVLRSNQLQQTSARLQTVIATSIDAVIVTDKNGIILKFNGSAERIFGYDRQQALGQSIGELIVPDHLRDAHEAGMQRMKAGGALHVVGKGLVRLESKRSTGEIFPIEMSIQAAKQGGEEIFVAFLRDISERVAAERELVGARDRALAGERAKANFLAVMSHEIRTPLNGLLGNLTLMKDTSLDDRQRDLARRMEMSGRLLMNHVNDVLDIAKYEAGKLRLLEEPLNLSEMLQDLTEAQRSDATAVGTTLSWKWVGEKQDWVLSDRARIEQLLINLVGNAIKFTENGSVSLQAEVLARNATTATLEFRVADTGIGIAAEDLDRIFGDFETLDSSYGRTVGGTGLGLGIARRITKAMGGEIAADSTLGTGSLFRIRLPLKIAQAPVGAIETRAVAQDRPAAVPQQARNILVVEDNEVNRHIARELLQRDGHRVSEAHDGAQGVARAAAEKFDLILMDISMPVMDGRQATQAIRSGNGASANAPIIAFTANVMPDEMALFTAGGMDDTLSKPIDVDALRQIIEKYAMGRTTHEANVEAPMEESNLLDLHRINETRELIGQQNFDKLFGRFEAEMDVLTEWLAHPENAPMPEIEVRCHKIASSAGTFGAVELRLALMAAETTARSRKQLDLSLACEKIIALWKDTRRAFRALEES